MHRFHAVGRGAAAEVAPVYDGHRQPALDRVPGDSSTVNAGAHYEQIELGISESVEVTFQDLDIVSADAERARANR